MPQRPVREILSRPEPVTATPGTTVRRAAELMTEHACGSVVVVDAAGRVVGIFTERDLTRRVVAAGLDPDTTPLSAVMTPEPDTIAADAPVADAVRYMDECGYKHLPVLDGERLIGVVAPEDIPFAEIAQLADELDSRHRLAERMW